MNRKAEHTDLQARRGLFLIQVEKDRRLDLQSLFPNGRPVCLEIGCGKGEFISEYALLHPELNFIGFELKSKRVDIVLRKLNPDKHANVRLAALKVDTQITKYLPENSLQGVFIQHPDPWPKRRHFKRRLVQQDFLDALSRVITPGGFIQVSTDHGEYAQWIWNQFSRRQDFQPVNKEGLSAVPLLEQHIVTYYEREQRRLGFEPRHMLFEKR